MRFGFLTAVILSLILPVSSAFGQMEREVSTASYFGFGALADFGLRTLETGPREGAFRRDSTYIYQRQPDAEMWIPTGRNIYHYCPNGRNNRIETSFRERNMGWLPESQTLFQYDGNDRITSKALELWNEDSADYVSTTRERYNYNFFGMASGITVENWVDGGWSSIHFRGFEYNSARILTSETDYEIVGSGGDLEWAPVTRRLLTYNEFADIQTETFQFWISETKTWGNQYNEVYVYNESNQLVDKILNMWNQVNESWLEIEYIAWLEPGSENRVISFEAPLPDFGSSHVVRFQETSMDTTGNPNSTITRIWSDEDWVPVERQIHHWSRTAAPHFPVSEIRCYFTNPYTLGGIWKCEGLKQNVPYILDVYDLQGRQRLSRQLPEDGTFRIDGHLPSGLYLMTFRGGLDTHTEKVYVRQ